MKRICRFVLAQGLPRGALNGQDAPALLAGARVRVLAPKHICTSPETWPCYRYVVGTLASIDSAIIVVRLENGEKETVSRVPATRLDVSAGRRACRAKCIVLGFVGGAVVGTFVTSGFAHSCRGDYCGLTYLPILPLARCWAWLLAR